LADPLEYHRQCRRTDLKGVNAPIFRIVGLEGSTVLFETECCVVMRCLFFLLLERLWIDGSQFIRT
jgi:hypothetical protein